MTKVVGKAVMMTMMTKVVLLQSVPTVIVEKGLSNLQKARRLRLATTHATAIHHAKVLATGPQKTQRGIAHCSIRPAVTMANAVERLLMRTTQMMSTTRTRFQASL